MFRFFLRDALWLMLVVEACADLQAQERGPTFKELLKQTTWNRYAPPAAAQSFHWWHTTPETRVGVTTMISWFPGTGSTAYCYKVMESGNCTDHLYIHNYSVRASGTRQLSPDDQASLRSILEMLPESTAEPPIERTILVSFQAGEKWRTETYDAAALPDEFERVMLIIGERRETKDRHKKK